MSNKWSHHEKDSVVQEVHLNKVSRMKELLSTPDLLRQLAADIEAKDDPMNKKGVHLIVLMTDHSAGAEGNAVGGARVIGYESRMAAAADIVAHLSTFTELPDPEMEEDA